MENTSLQTVSDELISSKIFTINGKKVILDKDLAVLYGVSTGNLNKAVKRNLKRFPEDFMFQVSKDNFNDLIIHNGTSSWGGTRSLPYAFTEQGVAMLSGVLNSDRAIQMNIQIMRIFTKFREMLLENLNLRLELQEIKNQIAEHDKNLENIFSTLDELIDKQEKPEERNLIGFKMSSSTNNN